MEKQGSRRAPFKANKTVVPCNIKLHPIVKKMRSRRHARFPATWWRGRAVTVAAKPRAPVRRRRPAPSLLDISPLTDLLSFHLRMLVLAVNRAYDEAFAETPLAGGTGKLTALMLIGANPGISQIEIGEVLSKDRPAMVRIIDHLEGEGMVLRQRRPQERRRYELTLTARGRASVKRFMRIAQDYDGRFFSPLDPGERRELARLLRKLRLVYQSETLGMQE